MTALPTNFLIQPSRGFDERTRGRTQDELAQYEMRIGFQLPTSYKTLMQQQNGGSVRHQKIQGFGEISFYGGLRQIGSELDNHVTNFREYILLTCDEDELLQSQQELAPFHPERLVLFASLDGHSGAYFDYGYRQTEPLQRPGVVFIGDDGDDFLHFGMLGYRFADFDAFLGSLSVDEEHEDSVYLGLETRGSYDAAIKLLAQQFKLHLKAYDEDDRNGHYNFSRWHSTDVPLELTPQTLAAYAAQNNTSQEEMQAWAASEGHTRHVYAIFCPNQHRSGTYLYQDHPDLCLVMEIRKSWFPMHEPLSALKDKLRQLPDVLRVVDLP
jgi:hypothetical protein